MVKSPKTPGRGMSSGAEAALKGFSYQIDVSVFAALRLLLIDNSATRLTLEPANEEDLEVDIAPDEPGRVVPIATTAQGYRLVIQVKLENGNPWSVEAFKRLLKKGTNRTPAKAHLDDPNVRYLLITSADATGVARDLLMTGFEDWPPAADFPASLKSTLTVQPEGRVGILGGLGERSLELEIDAVLGQLLHVPRPRRADCLAQLRTDARTRMGNATPGVWVRDDLQAVIRAHGGYLASGADRDAFVEPANYDAIASGLDKNHSVILSGPSGTGKTQTALALCDRARHQDGDVEIIIVDTSGDPSLVRSVSDPGPRVYYMEDPWGQNSLRGGSEAWTAQLPGILRTASDRRKFVITSRSDMLQQANAEVELRRWTVALEAENYADGQLVEIYNRRMDQLPGELQTPALAFRDHVLGVLETPLELDLFFTQLADGRAGSENDGEFLRRLLASAHRDAVEGAVQTFLTANDYNTEAIIIWAVLAARGQSDRSRLALIDRSARLSGLAMTRGLIPVVNRLTATRHLKMPGQSLSFAHPSVRAGFEALVHADWLLAMSALDALLDALVAMEGKDRDWGLETAARVLVLLQGWPGDEAAGPAYSPVTRVQALIDAWLDEALLDPAADFAALIALAADIGSPTSLPSEVARWFMHGVRRGAAWFLEGWSAPTYDNAWYQQVAADPRTATIAGRYIREILPRESHVYTDGMPADVDRLARGLEADYLIAARSVVGRGHELSVGAIAAGAVRDLQGFLPILDMALDVQAQNRAEYERTERLTWQAIEDGEYDEGFAEHFQSMHEDDGYVAAFFVTAWIDAMRQASRWRDLEHHVRSTEFAGDWADAIASSTQAPPPGELEAVFRCVRTDHDMAAAWRAVARHWDPAFDARLRAALVLRHNQEDLRQALVACALAAGLPLLRDVITQTGDEGQRVQLAIDLGQAIDGSEARRNYLVISEALAAGPPGGRQLLRALPTRKRVRPADGPALALAETAVETATHTALAALVRLLIASGARPVDAVERWLVAATDARDAEAAAEAAAELNDPGLLAYALAHPRASARRVALTALGQEAPGALSPALLALARDPGSGVRMALVKILETRRVPEHLEALLTLSEDTWSNDAPYYDADPSYPIAQRAVRTLSSYEELNDVVANRLIDLGLATRDPKLRKLAFAGASDLGSTQIRARMWNEVVRGSGRRPRLAAIQAMASATSIEETITNQVTASVILNGSPRLVAALADLIARHAPVPAVIALFEDVYPSLERRSLMVLGAPVLAARDPAAAEHLMSLLGSEHPARNLLTQGANGTPAAALDALGNVEVRMAVRPYLSRLFQE